MKLPLIVTLTVAALVLTGCSSTSAKVDHGPIRARTFSFVNRGAQATPDFAEQRQAIHTLIQEAITKNLAARGVQRVASGGEVTVGYLLILGNNATTTAINDYFGYGEDADALSDKAHAAYTASKNPNYFESGTLIVDLIDTRSFKLLNRGYATRPVLRNLSDEQRAVRIQEAVDEILRDLRVEP